jgi:branched-chain amino acid transport system permease protein
MPTRELVTSYRQELRLFDDLWQKIGLLLITVALLAFPLLLDDRWVTVGNHALIAVVGAVGLMILTGFAGQISMGHAAFLALGAYTTAVLCTHYHWPFWLAMPVSGLVAAMAGLTIGPFALKLRGLYLAIVTVGLVFLVNHLLIHLPEWTGGPAGVAVTSGIWFGAESRTLDSFNGNTPLDIGIATLKFEQILFYLFLLVAAFSTWMAKNLYRTNSGRAMMAVRDHDIAAAVLGVNPAGSKMIAFFVSSYLGGVAGSMLAIEQTYLTVDHFNLHLSIEYIAMIVLGGIGTVFGAVAGAIAYVFIEPMGHLVGDLLPFMASWTDKQQSTVVFAIVICAFLVFEPLGLFGIWLRIKRYFQTWPFRY